MLLGTPIVTADVGGVPSMITPEECTMFEGFRMEKAEDPQELAAISERLAEALCQVFAGDEMALSKAQKAKEHAKRTHDSVANNKRLIEIYQEIIS